MEKIAGLVGSGTVIKQGSWEIIKPQISRIKSDEIFTKVILFNGKKT